MVLSHIFLVKLSEYKDFSLAHIKLITFFK